MCGIAGVAGYPPTPEMLSAIAKAMVHRGPDDEGIFLSNEAGLAFRRLAIVDLESGRQPMTNEDQSLQLVFNGEIYDHHLLRQELQARGHHFVTDHSDTEVLVHGWEEWREQLFPKLNGMFGLAIWDINTRELILARDRYGIKPLYYAPLSGGAILFASEIKAILASGLVANEPSHAGILEYFSFQNLLRHQTMFKGIYQLEPATYAVWKDGRMTFHKFWDLSFPRSRTGTVTELAVEHRELLGKAIRRQVVADVPVKSYLSGGIDSTAITIASHHVDPQVTAYSCIFDLDGVGSDKTVDEREYSRLVAERYALNRVELELPQDTLRRCIYDYVRYMEDLRMGVGYPVYMIAHRVATDAKVVLSGTGGDEFHAGYVGRFTALGLNNVTRPTFSFRRLLSRIKHEIKNALLGVRKPAGRSPTEAAYRNILNFMAKPGELKSVFTSEFLRKADGFDANAVMDDFLKACPSDDWRDKVLYVDAKTYLAGLLAFEDKVSMAHSLETRVPLLDNDLVNFVLDVPFDVLCKGDTGKILFRESVRPWVPEAIYNKPKMGFGPPDSSWYRTTLRPWIEETLSSKQCAQRGVFKPDYVEHVLNEHFSGRRDNYYLIWSLLNFEHWCQAFGFFGATEQPLRKSA